MELACCVHNASRRKPPAGWIEQLRRPESDCPIVSSGDEDFSVAEQRRRVRLVPPSRALFHSSAITPPLGRVELNVAGLAIDEEVEASRESGTD
jgi:hypothetical protein